MKHVSIALEEYSQAKILSDSRYDQTFSHFGAVSDQIARAIGRSTERERRLGNSLLFYPLVGFIIGLILIGLGLVIERLAAASDRSITGDYSGY